MSEFLRGTGSIPRYTRKMGFCRSEAVTLFTLLLLTAAPSSAQTPTPVKSAESVLRFRLHGEPTTLDWNLAHTPYEIYLLVNLMEGLVRLPADMKPEPALATSWKIDEEGKRYTFKIRPGVKWSDGVPLKAQQFVDSWKRVLSPLTAASYAYFLFDIVGAAEYQAGGLSDFTQVGVHALDDLTLEVKLKHAVAHWILLPSFWLAFPVRQDLIDKYGLGWERPGKMVSLGPYLLTQYDEGKAYTMVANSNYYGGRPAIDRLVGEIIEKPEDAVEKFEQGTLDVATQLGAASFDVESKATLSKFLRKDTYLRTLYLGMNTGRFPTQKVELRRAIAAALPRAEFVKNEMVAGQTAGGLVPPGLVGHDSKAGMPFNLDGARKQMRLASLSSSTLPELELLCVDALWSLELAKWAAKELKSSLGLKIKVNALPLKAYMVRRQLKTAELFISSWAADFPDADNFLSVFQSNSGNNHTGWKNPDFDADLELGRSSSKIAERRTAYLRAQKRLQEEFAVVVPLYYDINESLISSKVSGVEITPLNQVFFRKARIQGPPKSP